MKPTSACTAKERPPRKGQSTRCPSFKSLKSHGACVKPGHICNRCLQSPCRLEGSLAACVTSVCKAQGPTQPSPHWGATQAAGVWMPLFFPFSSSCFVSCFRSDCQTHTMVLRSGKT